MSWQLLNFWLGQLHSFCEGLNWKYSWPWFVRFRNYPQGLACKDIYMWLYYTVALGNKERVWNWTRWFSRLVHAVNLKENSTQLFFFFFCLAQGIGIVIPMRLIAPFLSFFNLIYMMSVHHFLHHLGGVLFIFSYLIWWTILRLSMASTDQERSFLWCSEPSNRSLLHWNESRKPEAVQARYMQDLGDISEDVFQSSHWPVVVLVTLTSLLYWVYLNYPPLEFSRRFSEKWHDCFSSTTMT